MCRKAVCQTCQKATWVGCGQHIETALRGVEEKDRCHCPPDQKKPVAM